MPQSHSDIHPHYQHYSTNGEKKVTVHALQEDVDSNGKDGIKNIFRQKRRTSMVGRHPVLMRLKKIVAHGYDVVNREFRTGVGIKHGGLIDRVLAAGAGSLDRHELDTEV